MNPFRSIGGARWSVIVGKTYSGAGFVRRPTQAARGLVTVPALSRGRPQPRISGGVGGWEGRKAAPRDHPASDTYRAGGHGGNARAAGASGEIHRGQQDGSTAGDPSTGSRGGSRRGGQGATAVDGVRPIRSPARRRLGKELGEALLCLVCLANRTGVDLD